MAAETNDELINVREAAKECGRNMETVRRWIWGGKLPARKLGNQLFIRRGDLASYRRLPARSVPAQAGETAVREYDAGAKLGFPDRARAPRDRTEARIVKPIDAEEVRKMRDDIANKIEPRRVSAKYEPEASKGDDFLARAIAFRNKLRARGYPETDTAALVKKSREGRMRELRQSLH